MASVKRSKGYLMNMIPILLISLELIWRLPKSKDLDKAVVERLQFETIWDDYYLPELLIEASTWCPKGSKNTCCSVWSRFHMEVVQGIPTATAALKKKVRKRGRTVNATLPAHDSGREKSNSVGANERCLACVGYAYTMDNENRKVVELSKKLRVTKDRAIAIEGQVTALKEKVVSLETAQKKASDLEESSRDALEKQVVVDDDLRDRVKVLKKKVTSLKDQALLDVTYYNGLCFNAIYTAWDANAYLKETDFTIYGRKPVVGETLRVEGYNPKCSNFPPSVGDAPPRESEGRKETLVDVIGL
uniref:Uncharacterized protein n=1 Tax=Cannabis sativa TaxID=3483 RepID=A0A803P601_CANSA